MSGQEWFELSPDLRRVGAERRKIAEHFRVDPVYALTQLRGAARRDVLIAMGVSDLALRAALAGGRVFRPHRGTYTLPGTPKAIVAAASLRGQVSCLSACEYWGLAMVKPPDAPHVLVPTDRHPQPDRLRRLRVVGVHRDEPWQPGRLIQPVDQAIDHAGWCTTPLEQLVIINSALNKGKVDPAGIPFLSKGGERRLEWLRANVNRLADSVTESVALAVLTAGGLNPRSQVVREHGSPVDIVIGERHVIELDSWEFHGGREAFRRDRWKDRQVIAAGGLPARYIYEDVMDNLWAFALDVSRITGLALDARLKSRLTWMTTAPPGHLNRRQGPPLPFTS